MNEIQGAIKKGLDDWQQEGVDPVATAAVHRSITTANAAHRRSTFLMGVAISRSPDFTERAAVAILDDLAPIFSNAAGNITSDLVGTLVTLSVASSQAHYENLSFGGQAINVVPAAIRTEEEIAQAFESVPFGGRLLQEWVESSFSENIIASCKADVVKGMLNGRSYDQLAKKISERMVTTRGQLDTICRTFCQTCSNDALQALYRANGDIIQQWQWSSARLPSVCPSCIALDGTVWPMGSGPSIPLHPRCRCAALPYQPSFSKLGLSPHTELETPGAINLNETSAQWLMRQDDKTITSVVGPNRLALLKTGTVEFPDLLSREDYRMKKLDDLLAGHPEGTLAKAKEVVFGKPPRRASASTIKRRYRRLNP